MKTFKIVVLITGILVAGMAFNTMAQTAPQHQTEQLVEISKVDKHEYKHQKHALKVHKHEFKQHKHRDKMEMKVHKNRIKGEAKRRSKY